MEALAIIGIIVIIITLVIVVKNRAYKRGQSDLIEILFSKYLTENTLKEVLSEMDDDISSVNRLIRNSINNYGYWSDSGNIEEKKDALEDVKKILEDFLENKK